MEDPKVFFDTEFIDDGERIELISIGLVTESAELYLENSECDLSRAHPWVQQNVVPKLQRTPEVLRTRDQMAFEIRNFVGGRPEFWTYFGAYDWIALCQLYGRLLDVPPHWPHFVLDIKQELYLRGLSKPEHLRPTVEHHALADAVWTRQLYHWLTERSAIE